MQLHLVHAKMELEINCQPETALKVLDLARSKYSTCLSSISYVRAVIRVLTRLGDIKQIRWICQTALSESNNPATSDGAVVSNPLKGNRNTLSKSAKGSAAAIPSIGSVSSLKMQLEVLEEYLNAELILGVCDITHLNSIRERRNKIKTAVEEFERAKLGIVLSKDEAKFTSKTLYDCISELFERYDFNLTNLPEQEQSLRDRTRGKLSIDGQQKFDSDRMRGQSVLGSKRDMGAEFHLSMSGLPVVLRDLLSKLPSHTGPMPDIDGFVRHMKSIVLPPRPADEIMDESVRNDFDSAKNLDTLDKMNTDLDQIDENQDTDQVDEKDDVFRQRKRLRA